MSTATPAASRLRAEFRHPLSAADAAEAAEWLDARWATGCRTAILRSARRGTTHFLAVRTEACADVLAPPARGGSAQTEASATSGA